MKCPNCKNKLKSYDKFDYKIFTPYKCESCGTESKRKIDISVIILLFLNVLIAGILIDNYHKIGIIFSILIYLIWFKIFLVLDSSFGKMKDIKKRNSIVE